MPLHRRHRLTPLTRLTLLLVLTLPACTGPRHRVERDLEEGVPGEGARDKTQPGFFPC